MGRCKNIKPSQKHPTVTETQSRYRNTQPLQQHLVSWCFEPSQPQRAISGLSTETLGRYRNLKPLQKHPTVTETQSRCNIRTVTETPRRFRNIDVSQHKEDLLSSAYVRARSPRDHIHVQWHSLLASKVHTCKHNYAHSGLLSWYDDTCVLFAHTVNSKSVKNA